MSIRTSLLAVSFLAASTFAVSRLASAASANDGDEINVHNHTGHAVFVFLFDDANVHTNEHGGVNFAQLKDGESAVARVPHCTFGILLVDHEDIWHAEFHDCHSTDLTFTKDTGHGKKQ
jgi:hypothetical protein